MNKIKEVFTREEVWSLFEKLKSLVENIYKDHQIHYRLENKEEIGAIAFTLEFANFHPLDFEFRRYAVTDLSPMPNDSFFILRWPKPNNEIILQYLGDFINQFATGKFIFLEENKEENKEGKIQLFTEAEIGTLFKNLKRRVDEIYEKHSITFTVRMKTSDNYITIFVKSPHNNAIRFTFVISSDVFYIYEWPASFSDVYREYLGDFIDQFTTGEFIFLEETKEENICIAEAEPTSFKLPSITLGDLKDVLDTLAMDTHITYEQMGKILDKAKGRLQK